MSASPKYVRTVASPVEINDNVSRILTFVDRYDATSACDILFAACGQQLAQAMRDKPHEAIARAEQSASRLVEVVVKAVNRPGVHAVAAGND